MLEGGVPLYGAGAVHSRPQAAGRRVILGVLEGVRDFLLDGMRGAALTCGLGGRLAEARPCEGISQELENGPTKCPIRLGLAAPGSAEVGRRAAPATGR